MTLHVLVLKTRQLFDRTEGASAIEYAIVAAMVATLVVLFISPIGTEVFNIFNDVLKGLGGTAVVKPA
ncbi:Flp family type IVb pilin [Pseudomonas sp. Irchel s3h17]|uniref:Flp family type IVb pilin n=1 Tax=Pseudomonas sp. Irchel s3h17 TaxID=2009182 RepID=UPI000BA44946|nr:Flp family type IVb pilin [Pseudomonas sp. Irchel s3h17]